MSKKDLTSVDNTEQGKGKAAESFPGRTEQDDDDPRWMPEGRPRTGSQEMSSIEEMLRNQRRGFFDYVLIFFGYILPILVVLGASAYFLTRQ